MCIITYLHYIHAYSNCMGSYLNETKRPARSMRGSCASPSFSVKAALTITSDSSQVSLRFSGIRNPYYRLRMLFRLLRFSKSVVLLQ